MAPTLGELIGPMLGVDWSFVHARGSGTVHDEPRNEVYAEGVGLRALERDDGIIQAVTPDGSTTTYRGQLIDRGPALPRSRWLGQTDRLLRPSQLSIWGRPGEDWRLSESVTTGQSSGVFSIEVVSVFDDRRGAVDVDTSMGHAVAIDLPGVLTWRIDELEDEPERVHLPQATRRSRRPTPADVVRHVLETGRETSDRGP